MTSKRKPAKSVKAWGILRDGKLLPFAQSSKPYLYLIGKETAVPVRIVYQPKKGKRK